MLIIRSLAFIVIGLALSGSAVPAQTTYYVQSVKAKVLSAPSFKAPMLGEASRGTKLTLLKKEGTWVKISYYGKDGYVASILVSPYPPLGRLG